MSKWIDCTLDERRLMLQEVAREYNINWKSVEKDWWVTMVLKAMFHTSFAPYLLFKGGTSLSKGWHIIHRFSEDIDISFDRKWFLEHGYNYAYCENKSQRERLRKKSREIITTEFVEELRNQLTDNGLSDFAVDAVTTHPTKDGKVLIDSDKDPTVIQVEYKSIVTTESGFDYVLPIVKVEISCLSMSEPFSLRTISSLIYDKFPDEDNESLFSVNTVSPERTFLEKAFLLNEEFQKKTPRTRRMSRHYYDLEKLMNTEYGKMALQNIALYNRIIDHRRKYNTLHYMDYELDRRENISILPPTELLHAFEKDYAEMKENMVFKDTLPFDELLRRIAELQECFHKIQ